MITRSLRKEPPGPRGRSIFIVGVTADAPPAWKVGLGQGRFLPSGDPRRRGPFTVLGPRTKEELFGGANAIGEHVRIGGERFLPGDDDLSEIIGKAVTPLHGRILQKLG